MSKQLLINDRPADNGASYGGFGGGGGDDYPKASIGNYKGVMLCNRPNEMGVQRKVDRAGGNPFNPRVQPDEPLGWNPTKKLMAKVTRKKIDPNSILIKHRKFIKGLEEQKQREKSDKELTYQEQEERKQQFKDQAEKQRKKIKDLKKDDVLQINDTNIQEEVSVAPRGKLTEDNLKRNDASQADSRKKAALKSGKAKQKPAWAQSEKQSEDVKEMEVEDLLEFAYELDYEKYMDDFEVRQALAIIKDRVKEIRQDDDWKVNIAKQWNEEIQEGELETGNQAQRRDNDETRSQVSYKSGKSNLSKKSLRTAVLEAVEEEGRPHWDKSVKSEIKQSTEDRVAARLANEILKDNLKLRGIHSGNSLKKLLEKEAKKALMAGADEYKGPVISIIKEKQRQGIDPNNLPYLHKNPAV